MCTRHHTTTQEIRIARLSSSRGGEVDRQQFADFQTEGGWTNRVQLRQCANLRRWRTPPRPMKITGFREERETNCLPGYTGAAETVLFDQRGMRIGGWGGK